MTSPLAHVYLLCRRTFGGRIGKNITIICLHSVSFNSLQCCLNSTIITHTMTSLIKSRIWMGFYICVPTHRSFSLLCCSRFHLNAEKLSREILLFADVEALLVCIFGFRFSSKHIGTENTIDIVYVTFWIKVSYWIYIVGVLGVIYLLLMVSSLQPELHVSNIFVLTYIKFEPTLRLNSTDGRQGYKFHFQMGLKYYNRTSYFLFNLRDW